jgi:hypothetical protein
MSTTGTTLLEKARLHWKDLLCLLVLVVASLMVRVGSLDRIALNPDESQYEATASYMLSTGMSSFEIPHTSGGTYGLYKLMGALFGPYSMYEMRVLVLLVVLFMTVLLYVMVRGESSPWCGLATGLIFVHYNLYYEGLTANREWFSAACLLLGAYLFWLWDRNPGRRGNWIILAAGLATSVALWFKLQAAFLVMVVPALILWRVLVGEGRQRNIRALLVFGAGGALGVGAYFGGFLAAGTLGEYASSIITDWNLYTTGNVATAQPDGGGADLYLRQWFLHRPFRPLLLIAYATSTITLALMIARLIRRRPMELPGFDTRLVRLFAVFLFAALITVSLGQRFFEHYFLYLVFPVAALAGLAIHAFFTAGRESPSLRYFALAWIALLLVDRLFMLLAFPPARILRDWPGSVVVLTYLLGIAALLIFGLVRPLRRAPAVAAGLICLEIGLLVLFGQFRETPRSLPHHRQGFDSLVQYLQRNAAPDDRLFVWGWTPEIYSLTRLEAASHLTICQYVVNDTVAEQSQPAIDTQLADELMRNLRSREPRFIVDAAQRSWTILESAQPWIYDLSLYPEFELTSLLEERYENVGSFDGCELYVLREPTAPRGS